MSALNEDRHPVVVAPTDLHTLSSVEASCCDEDAPVAVEAGNAIYLKTKAGQGSGVDDVFRAEDPMDGRLSRQHNPTGDTQATQLPNLGFYPSETAT